MPMSTGDDSEGILVTAGEYDQAIMIWKYGGGGGNSK